MNTRQRKRQKRRQAGRGETWRRIKDEQRGKDKRGDNGGGAERMSQEEKRVE